MRLDMARPVGWRGGRRRVNNAVDLCWHLLVSAAGWPTGLSSGGPRVEHVDPPKGRGWAVKPIIDIALGVAQERASVGSERLSRSATNTSREAAAMPSSAGVGIGCRPCIRRFRNL
jgi:hypothetical protein